MSYRTLRLDHMGHDWSMKRPLSGANRGRWTRKTSTRWADRPGCCLVFARYSTAPGFDAEGDVLIRRYFRCSVHIYKRGCVSDNVSGTARRLVLLARHIPHPSGEETR